MAIAINTQPEPDENRYEEPEDACLRRELDLRPIAYADPEPGQPPDHGRRCGNNNKNRPGICARGGSDVSEPPSGPPAPRVTPRTSHYPALRFPLEPSRPTIPSPETTCRLVNAVTSLSSTIPPCWRRGWLSRLANIDAR